MPSEVVLGVDIGTTSTKVGAFGVGSADALFTTSAGYPLLTSATGPDAGQQRMEPDRAEQDPDVVRGAALEAIAEAAERARHRGEVVAGICFSAAMHSLMGVDRDGRPLTRG